MLNSIETIGLRVESITPQNYSTNVDVNSVIEVEFNSDLDVKTIVDNFFVLKDTNRVVFERPTEINIADFEKIEGSLSYKNRVVIFRPVSQLDSATRYIVYVPKGSIKDFKSRTSWDNYIAIFDTDGFATFPPCEVTYPASDSVISSLDKVELEDIGADSYVVQISKNSDFENGLYDEVIKMNSIEDDFNLGEGSYYIRARATNGDFGKTSFFTIRTLPNTLVSDEDEVFIYEPLGSGIELIDAFPKGINIHEKTNLAYMKFDGKISVEDIDLFESGLFERSVADEDYNLESLDGAFSIIHDSEENLTYIAFIPDSI